MNEQHHTHDANAGAAADSADSARRAARRRLIKGGLSAAPVAMTVASRPVLATSTCHGPTGFQSANVSRAVGKLTDPACGSRKLPGDWAASGVTWPSAYKRTDSFKTHFPGTTKYTDATHTLEKILKAECSGNGDDKQVSQLIVAALLNSASNPVPSAAQIKAMWAGYCNNDFQPGGEAPWTASKFSKYLQYTMGIGVQF
jgi:hypothetical protein